MSNLWLRAVAEPGPNTQASEIWYAYNAGRCQTITVTWVSATGFRYAAVSEFSGVQVAADPLDKLDNDLDAGTAPNSITTPDVTPSTAGQLIYIAGRNTGLGPGTPNAPFAQLNQCGQADVDGYVVQGGAAAVHADINNTGDTHWIAQIATFKALTVAALVAGQKAAAGATPGALTLSVSLPAPSTPGSLLIVHAGAGVAILNVTDDQVGGSDTRRRYAAAR